MNYVNVLKGFDSFETIHLLINGISIGVNPKENECVVIVDPRGEDFRSFQVWKPQTQPVSVGS